MYKGTYVKTVSEADFGPEADLKHRFSDPARVPLGRLLKIDIGRQIWSYKGILYAESIEQRDARLKLPKELDPKNGNLAKQMLELTEKFITERQKLLDQMGR